jgi:hypothetical protein
MPTLADLQAAVEQMEANMAAIQESEAKARLSLADWFAANMEEANAKRG